MVGKPEMRRRLLEEVAVLYDWIDAQAKPDPARAGRCRACGACCDFPAYDHRLFVTPPELMYLATKLNATHLKPMPGGRCRAGRRVTPGSCHCPAGRRACRNGGAL